MLLCAVGLGVTAIVRAWFSAHGVSAGLWGVEAGGRGVRWDNVPGIDFDIIVSGYTATASGVLAAIICGAIALATMSGRATRSVPAARFATSLALISIGWFVIRILMDSKLGVDWGLFVGTASAIGLAYSLRRIA